MRGSTISVMDDAGGCIGTYEEGACREEKNLVVGGTCGKPPAKEI